MAHRLHLVRGPDDTIAYDVIREQSREQGACVSVVLLPGAADPVGAVPAALFRLIEGEAGDPGAGRAISHQQLLELIFEADSVVAW
jgi:hypothetical protein